MRNEICKLEIPAVGGSLFAGFQVLHGGPIEFRALQAQESHCGQLSGLEIPHRGPHGFLPEPWPWCHNVGAWMFSSSSPEAARIGIMQMINIKCDVSRRKTSRAFPP